MKNTQIQLIGAVLLFSLLVLARAGDSVTETMKFENVQELDIINVTGKIDITGWDKEYVEVTYVKKARDEEDFEEIDVDIDQRGDVLYIVTDLPWRCRKCAVDYEISLPTKFKAISAETVTGAVTIEDMDFVDEVAAKSTTGSIKGDFGASNVDARVVTGRIKLYINEIAENGNIEAETVTGSIDIMAPENFQADVYMSAVTGNVRTGFSLHNVDVKKKNKLEGRIGKGDIICRLSTVTGSIYLGER